MRYLLFVFLFISYGIFAQSSLSLGVSITMPTVALMDIEPNNTAITLNVAAPTEAGNPVSVAATNNTKWLNFSSAVPTGTTRRIGVQLSGTLPTGLNLKLVTANYAGTGAGTLGSPVSTIYLSSTQQTVINNIGGAYTGNGSGNGYNLTYSVEISNYSLLKAQSATVSIIYTLIDN